MKVVFLDFDGVLNNGKAFKRWQQGEKPADLQVSDCVDPAALTLLNELLDKTGAKVVVSSTWRTLYTLEWLQNHLNRFGFQHSLMDVTPGNDTKDRGDEVAEWLENHPEVETYVVLDDMLFGLEKVEDRVVRTNFSAGLCPKHVKQAVEMLNGE